MLHRLSFPLETEFTDAQVAQFEALEQRVRDGVPEASYVGTTMPPYVNNGRTMVMFEVWLDPDDVCCVHFAPSPDANRVRVVVVRDYDVPQGLTDVDVDVSDDATLQPLFNCIREPPNENQA